jgi:FAD/FMN-containing dehydrogenase
MTTLGERDAVIARPGDLAFAAATGVFNLAAPVRPAAAVTVHTVAAIRAALGYADAHGLAVRVHSTGHASATARPMDDALLIRTRLAGGVEVDTRRRVARVPAGTRWGAVVDAAAAHGLAAPHGSSPTVGVVGFLLRGGVSCYGRQVGIAANSVRAIELVTADGELRRVDAAADPDLFWALRGGGGGFGVVTAVEIGLFPAATVITGAAFWPAAQAHRLLSLWTRWTRYAPRCATTSLRILNLPKVPAVPPALSAGPVLCIDGVLLSPTAGDLRTAQRQADDLLGPLRAVAEPILDNWRVAAPAAAAATHMDPAEPVAVLGDHLLLREIGADGASEFLRLVGDRSGSPLVSAELRQLGGALSTPDPAGGAVNHLAARYAYIGAGLAGGPVADESIVDYCAAVRTALAPWDTGRTAPTFVESLEQPQGILDADQVRAVDAVRAWIDPAGRFRDDIAPNASALR